MIDTLITGAGGFIGKHLIKRLPDATSIKNDDMYRGFARDYIKVFFLSTYGNMAHHFENWKTVNANVTDLLAALVLFKGWMCYMSSSSILLPVQTPYSRTKRAAEEILKALPDRKSCIVRPFSVTGVGEQKEHLIPTLIRSCFEGTEITFDPAPTHDFIDVSDVCDALVRLADDRATGVFEFGNGIAVSNEEVRRMVEEVTGRKANITDVKPMRAYDTEDWRCQTQNKYWEPTKSLRTSITEMVEAYKHEKA